ncbi:MAG: hypothetical protein E6J90_49580 [Deltaproteobacteria bacterium]|nr:MAG: hypothetical protein E6J90_49580 [Deltaproteobacteria bacterium]
MTDILPRPTRWLKRRDSRHAGPTESPRGSLLRATSAALYAASGDRLGLEAPRTPRLDTRSRANHVIAQFVHIGQCLVRIRDSKGCSRVEIPAAVEDA